MNAVEFLKLLEIIPTSADVRRVEIADPSLTTADKRFYRLIAPAQITL